MDLKKVNGWSLLFSMVVCLHVFILQPSSAKASEELDLNAESAILADAQTGEILYQKSAKTPLPAASMTKMMTEYLVMEAIANGEISWDTTTILSDYAYSIAENPSFAGVGLEANQEYTVRELFEAMAINSDNAATITLAELVAGSEGQFVNKMNQKAEEMGLPEYQFVNASGLDNLDLGENYPEGTDPSGVNLLSARSAALLAFHLIHDYPEILEISSMPQTEIDGELVLNWNYMLPHDTPLLQPFFYEGVDGLKTGFTDLAGYSFTGTADRSGNRLISVVMRTDSEGARFQETAKLLDYGFSNFKMTELFPEGYQKESMPAVPVAKGEESMVDVSLGGDFTLPIKSEQEGQYHVEYTIDSEKVNEDGSMVAPIEQGEVVGEAELVYAGETNDGNITGDPRTVPLVTDQAVEQSNWFQQFLGGIGNFFNDLYLLAVNGVKGIIA